MKHQIGSHSVVIAGDIARIFLVGDCAPQDMTRIVAALDSISGEEVYYVIADVRALGSVPPETRRVAGAWKGIRRAGATAIIGANVIARTLITLVSRASTLLSNTTKTGELLFCKTEEEALDWIDAHRLTLSRKATG